MKNMQPLQNLRIRILQTLYVRMPFYFVIFATSKNVK